MAKKRSKTRAARPGNGVFSLLASLGLAALGQALLLASQGQGALLALGWILVLAGGLTLWAGRRAGQWSGGIQGPLAAEKSPPLWLEASALAAILVLALGLRLYNIHTQPNAGFRDEGQNGNVAIQIMKGEVVDGTDTPYPVYIEQDTQNATGYFYPVALAFKAFGISILSERFVSVFYGVLAVAAFFFLARFLFGAPLALFLTLGLATLRWHINFSRIGFLGIMTVFLEIPLFYFLLKGFWGATTDPLKRVPGWLLGLGLGLGVLRMFLAFHRLGFLGDLLVSLLMFSPLLACLWLGLKDLRSSRLIMAGFVLAFALYSYIAARLLVLVVLGTALYQLFSLPGYLKGRARTLLAGAFGLLALGSLLLVEGSVHATGGLETLGKALCAAGGLLFLGLLAWRGAWMKGWWKPLALGFGSALFFSAPLTNYSMLHWGQVQARSDRVSIFNNKEADKRAWGVKLLQEVPLTLDMVNVRGDGNPRHNLPNAPMLNPAWAAAVALGVFFCLLLAFSARPFFFLLWWQVALLAGYYSIEAPQAYRTITAIPVLLLFLGMVLEQFWVRLKSWLKDSWSLVVLPLLGLFFVVGALFEARVYFVGQANDPGCWAEFSAAEYLMGQDLRALEPGTHGLVRPDWADSYTFRFMTYPDRDYEYFNPSTQIPLRNLGPNRGKNFLYILGPTYLPLLPMLRRYYPKGDYREVRHPMTGTLLYWTYFVPAQEAEDLETSPLSGLTGSYFEDNADPGRHWLASNLRFKRLDPFLLFDWTVDPVPGHFSVEWDGRLKIDQAGLYHFFTLSNDYAQVRIDGHDVVNRGHEPAGDAWAEGSIRLSRGTHPVRIRYYEERNYSRMEVWWQAPGGDKEVLPSSALLPK